MSKVKILFADHAPFAGGAQLRLAEDIQFLDRDLFDPFLVIDSGSPCPDIYNDSNVQISQIPFPKLKLTSPVAISHLIHSARNFQKLIKEIQPEIVLANTTRTLLIVALVKKVFQTKFKLVSFIRDYDYPKWVFKLIQKEVDQFLFVSQSVKDFYNQTGDVVYLGSNIAQPVNEVTPGEILAEKKKWNIKKGDFVVGFVGRLVDWKGGMTVLDAILQINNPKIKLIFFGTGHNQAGSIEEQLKEKVKNLQVEDQVIFAGHTPKPALAYKMMDCFILASIKPEPFATTVIEAAFAQVPILATNIGGTKEFIQSGKNGLLVNPAETNELAQALLRLKKDKAFARKLVNQALQDAQWFDEKIFIKKLERKLLEI